MKYSLIILCILAAFSNVLAGCSSSTETTVTRGPSTPTETPSGSDQINIEEIDLETEGFNRELLACTGSNIVCTVSVMARATARGEELARAGGHSVTYNSPTEVARTFENTYSISCVAGRCTIQRRAP